MDESIVSQDYKQNQEERVFRYKGYKFAYGPKDITITEDSRIAEYRYLFRDGAEYTKVRGVKKIEMSGIFIAGPVDTALDHISAFTKYTDPRTKRRGTTALQLRSVFDRLQDNKSGWLILPGYGNFICFLTDTSFSETGDYSKEIEFRLTFIQTKPNPSITEIPETLRVAQEDKPDEEKLLIEHVIVSGDTLNTIANRYGVTLGHIKAVNPELFDRAHQNGNLIRSGEVVTINKSSNEAWVPYKSTPVLSKAIKGSKDIPRNSRTETHLKNKGNEVRALKTIAGVVFGETGETIVSKSWEFYRDSIVGDSILMNPEKAQEALGNLQRNLQTTVEKYKKQKALEQATSVDTSSTTVVSTMFPTFDGAIQYPKDRYDRPIVDGPYIANNPQTVA